MSYGWQKDMRGPEIKKELRALGVSQRRLAKMAGVSQPAMNQFLFGHTTIGPEGRARIEAALAKLVDDRVLIDECSRP